LTEPSLTLNLTLNLTLHLYDLTDSCSGSWTTNQKYDYLPRDIAHQFALSYAGNRTLAEVSPCNVDLSDFPPLFIEYGDSECLHDQIETFIVRAKQESLDVTAYSEPGMVHVFPLFVTVSDEGSAPHLAFSHMEAFMDRIMGRIDMPIRYEGVCQQCTSLTRHLYQHCNTVSISTLCCAAILAYVLFTAPKGEFEPWEKKMMLAFGLVGAIIALYTYGATYLRYRRNMRDSRDEGGQRGSFDYGVVSYRGPSEEGGESNMGNVWSPTSPPAPPPGMLSQ